MERFRTVALGPIEQFVEGELKAAKAKRKTFRTEAGKYDTKLASVTKLQAAGADKADKLAQAKRELQTQEDKCQELKDELIKTYEDLSRHVKDITREPGARQRIKTGVWTWLL